MPGLKRAGMILWDNLVTLISIVAISAVLSLFPQYCRYFRGADDLGALLPLGGG
jgi:hypothetical protein